MCKQANGHRHSHPHTHAVATPRNHVAGASLSAAGSSSRREFLRILTGGAIAGATMLELAAHRAVWANVMAAPSDSNLFDISKAADGVFFAYARPQAMINCNAAIFVRSNDVVVVDAHSKPSAAAALLAQIKREVTPKPVRFVINTHFHWDHTLGDPAYRASGNVDFVATDTTKQLMSQFSVERLKASLDTIPPQIEKLRQQSERASSAEEKAFCAEQIRQLKAYVDEMKNFHLELPTITFEKSYALADPTFDLHLGFHGHAHTAGDAFVFCPQRRAIATGDASHGWLPFIGDGYPKSWPGTIDEVAKLEFRYVLGGHGPLQHDRTIMTCQRNYIEELAGRVERAKQAGLSLADTQRQITVDSLRSLQANGYREFLEHTAAYGSLHWGPVTPLQEDVNTNTEEVYKAIDRV